ncbi:MAG: hypothetical protein GY842_19750 [bacterium]|nr:hypothetical protein [bacterium]
MTHPRPGLALAILLSGLVLVSGGCNLLIPIALISNPKKKVAPEYDKLPDARSLILVWADPATLFDYPHVQLELAMYVHDKLAVELRSAELVDPALVEDYRERTLDGSPDPQVVGREFDAEMVIYLELLQFQIRDPDAPDYLRAEIEASVSVHNLTADPDEPQIHHLKPVHVFFPAQGGALLTSANSAQVRQGAYLLFAEEVARKFYEYEEEY